MSNKIKKRVFGADIPFQVKQKLEAMQKVGGGVGFGEEITSDYLEFYDQNPIKYKAADVLRSDTDGLLDLSSRVPWARMWTSLVVEEESAIEVDMKTEEAANKAIDNPDVATDEQRKEGIRVYYTETPDSDRDTTVMEWTVRPVAKTFYTVGNHIVNQFLTTSPTALRTIEFENNDRG